MGAKKVQFGLIIKTRSDILRKISMNAKLKTCNVKRDSSNNVRTYRLSKYIRVDLGSRI